MKALLWVVKTWKRVVGTGREAFRLYCFETKKNTSASQVILCSPEPPLPPPRSMSAEDIREAMELRSKFQRGALFNTLTNISSAAEVRATIVEDFGGSSATHLLTITHAPDRQYSAGGKSSNPAVRTVRSAKSGFTAWNRPRQLFS
jgi:hypothetical protein